MYFGDYAKETTTTTGTGNITLAGAVTQHQTIASIVQVGDPFPYSLLDANGTAREVGIGTLLTSTTMSRDTIESSTNSGSAISLSSGTHSIFVDVSAIAMNKRPVFGDFFIDFVQSGLAVPTSSGSLTGSITSGVAYVVGQRVVKGAQSRAYTASKDTYVDVSNKGVYTYVEVTNGGTVPAVTSNSIRIGKVVTGSSTISSGTDLANRIYQPACVLRTSTSQTVAHGTFTALAFPDGEITNNAGMHSTSSNNTRITTVVAGIYSASCEIDIGAINSGGSGYSQMGVQLLVSNTTGVAYSFYPKIDHGAGVNFGTSAAAVYMNVGDYMEVRTIHFNSAAVTTQTVNSANFSLVRCG